MPTIEFATAVVLYALAINLASLLAFAWDKHCARNQMRRVSEQTLLVLAAAGGTVGAVIAQYGLRHKTRKQPFRTYLMIICSIQAIALVAFCAVRLHDAIWTT
ncbi:DUF1294 domain-containing protein [Breoghania sp. L-A4]|uniref:DUF1294 domain-containing protein n=1 Tax=Breoghania sp. L-A4 TaxID=2304600 RepID=UPI000E359218|nr:DUF1294 domain-containing protein [Breoghania sp. L-A4]AXS40847.1 DUF1294 domain-containing protein [Breoghania sp. L-A4]